MKHKSMTLRAASIALILVLGSSHPALAGAYIFAGEVNGIDIITHPQGYTGVENVLNVEVCIDPASPVPTGASSLADLETSVQNNIVVWNQLQPTLANAVLGASNNVGPTEIDFESVALHELGHCIGLAHVNFASESGITGPDTEYTKSTDGVVDGLEFNTPDFNIAPGTDGVRGTLDDVRGNDVNLHWFRTDTNDPGQLPLPVPVDASTYDRDQSSLPAGHDYAQNLDRTAAGVMGHPATTEAVMQQGSFFDEAQRTLTADGVATVLLARSGVDEVAGTTDDYTINLTYGGISSAASCNVTLDFAPSATVGLAFCQTGGTFIGANHVRITTAIMRFGEDFNWFFNQEPATPLVPADSMLVRAVLIATLLMALGGMLLQRRLRPPAPGPS